MILAGECQISYFKHKIHFSDPEKRRIWYVAVPHPQDSTHMLSRRISALLELVGCALSLLCPCCVCRKLCALA